MKQNPALAGKQKIGILGERTLHQQLKLWLEPDENCWEQPVGAYVADIFRPDQGEIIEIQTRQLFRLEGKLRYYLSQGYRVEVVYPVALVKWVRWLDPETGELSQRKKSPRPERPAAFFQELYGLRKLVGQPGLSFRLILLELEQYRLLNGWGPDKKRGSHRWDRVPIERLGELCFASPQDFLALLPQALPEKITTAWLAKELRIPRTAAQSALGMLSSWGVLERTGKEGRAYCYALPPAAAAVK